jgi:hypothetical protein
MTEAAWQADPTGRHQYRYWDGTRWTDHVADDGVTAVDPVLAPPPVVPPAPAPVPVTPAAPTASTAGARSGWRPGTIAMVVGALVLAVGSIGPWAEISAGFFSQSVNGTDGDGTITLVAAILILVIAVVTASTNAKSGLVVIALLAAMIAGGTGIIDAIDVRNRASDLADVTRFADAHVGWGLWATIGGAAVALVGAFLRARELAGTTVHPLPPGVQPPTSGDADGYL